MNPLIKELAKEAAREMNETGTYSEPKFQEKFAELLIRACANQCRDDDNAFDMLKHFGLEQ